MGDQHQLNMAPETSRKQDELQANFAVDQLKDWALLNGLVMRPSTEAIPKSEQSDNSIAMVAPLTVYPTLLDRELYDRALELSEPYNELYANISMDEEWLGQLVEEIAKIDDFH